MSSVLNRICFLVCLAAAGVPALAPAGTAGDPPDAGTGGRLDRYDVVWDSPSKDYTGSMPLGNGDIGLNLWVEEGGDLCFYIGKTDAWGDNGRLLKVGKVRVRIEPDPWKAGRAFRQVLSLREGAVFIRYGDPGKGVALEIRVDAHHPVIYLQARSRTPFTLTAGVELWRKEPHALPSLEVSDVLLDRSKPKGMHAPLVVEPDTLVEGYADRIGWFHHNKKSVGPEMTLRIQGLSGFEMQDPLLHRTFGAVVTAVKGTRVDAKTLETAPATEQLLRVYVLTRHPSTPEAWRGAMDRLIEHIEKTPLEERIAAHRAWWRTFWDRSWIFAEDPAGRKISMVPPNAHPVRLGVDQEGRNPFQGTLGRVSLFNVPLSEGAIESLAGLDRRVAVEGREGLLYSSTGPGRGPIGGSRDWSFEKGLGLEAWIRPGALPPGGGRIVDKITPGKDDGFLLDTYPGDSLRLITRAGTVEVEHVLPGDRWVHVAASVDPKRSVMALYLDGKKAAVEAFERNPDAAAVTRAYILQRFINACAGRGAYPIKFNGSIFTVPSPGCPGDADYRRWGPGYWWQNTRLPYLGMCASGDFDLMQPLFKMYGGDVFELSKYRTRRYFGHGGAFFPECIYFWGAVFSDTYGWTPYEERKDKLQESRWHKWEWVGGLELAWMMLDYYDHTLDETFLEERALPVADAVLTFFDRHYRTGKDGKLVMHPAQALETWWDCTNPMPEVAGLHAVTDRLLRLPERLTKEEQRRAWRALRAELPELPTRKVEGATMLAPAEQFAMKRNIENPELYAVFPFRLIALGKPGLEKGISAFEHRWDKGNFGWRQEEIFMAYLGLAEPCRDNLAGRARNKHEGSRFPAFWGPNYDWVPDQDHGGVLMKAFQSMLLQTDGRKIHLLPAWPRDWDVEFKLHAPSRTTVEARVRRGRIEHLEVVPASRRADLVMPRGFEVTAGDGSG